MNSKPGQLDEHLDPVCLYALQALPSNEIPAVEAHLAECASCRQEIEKLRSVVDLFLSWPADVLRPPVGLWDRLAQRIADETGRKPLLRPPQSAAKAEWEEVAPGISVQLFATDTKRSRVSMLVRLAPGTDYPAHRHAGVEELHLLQGELMIDAKKLYPGDYIRAEAGSVDRRVWSETGCTCVLVTSTEDLLFEPRHDSSSA